MDREIKFRVWCSIDNEMFYSEPYQVKTDMIFGLSNFLREVPDIADTLMQFTGLKDDNGVDIYEGDYLLDGHSGRFAEVKFYNGAFVVEFDGDMQDLYDWTCECIIGNIYETKILGERL